MLFYSRLFSIFDSPDFRSVITMELGESLFPDHFLQNHPIGFGLPINVKKCLILNTLDSYITKLMGSDGNIRFHRGIDRQQRTFSRIFNRSLIGQHPIENRFAILSFTNL